MSDGSFIARYPLEIGDPWNNSMKFSPVPGGTRHDCSSPGHAPLAEDCCTYSNLADSVRSIRTSPATMLVRADRIEKAASLPMRPSQSAAPFRLPALMLGARLLASMPAAVPSKERP
jgi:hypothetical protein